MIRSMTGFGRADVAADLCSIGVEARSVNHRHLDLAIRLPRPLASLEPRVRRVLSQRLERGRVDLTVQLGPGTGASLQRVAVDTVLAREYADRARALAAELGVTADVSLAWILERSGVVRLEEPDLPDADALWPTCELALTRAIDALIAQRTAEGGALTAELRALRAELATHVDAMLTRAPAGAARREARLRERIKALVEGAGVDETRVLTEVAIWAEKSDVAEELARLRSHLEQVGTTLDKGGPVGRSLDFLLQELNREVNTVASKADDLELSQVALAAKGVLEKMREQVQNLE
ncbi:MAG: YicC family protein [Candidatus Rokubacteria bacterium]|nr:YicC family protein [Candidatus Rokubacteria bacterium]